MLQRSLPENLQRTEDSSNKGLFILTQKHSFVHFNYMDVVHDVGPLPVDLLHFI